MGRKVDRSIESSVGQQPAAPGLNVSTSTKEIVKELLDANCCAFEEELSAVPGKMDSIPAIDRVDHVKKTAANTAAAVEVRSQRKVGRTAV